MPAPRAFSEVRLVNGSAGDPALYLDYPGKNNALLFDAGDLCPLNAKQLGDLEAVFLTHHHMDHFVGFDRVLRANLDQDKTLHVFGPDGTIRRVHQRVTAYEHGYYPFQKLVLHVRDLLPGRVRSARLECARHFPPPEVEESAWKGPVVYENADLAVEAAPADHTAPCYAFALVERTGYHPDPDKLAAGSLRPGPWVSRALDLLRGGAPPETVLEIDGGRFRLGVLGEHYFAVSRGARVAFVTDTLWSEASRPGLLKLAHRARRLYCDSYYAQAQARQAAVYRHMTAAQAGELAASARVEELVLMHFGPRYAGRYHELVDEARALFPKVTAEV